MIHIGLDSLQVKQFLSLDSLVIQDSLIILNQTLILQVEELLVSLNLKSYRNLLSLQLSKNYTLDLIIGQISQIIDRILLITFSCILELLNLLIILIEYKLSSLVFGLIVGLIKLLNIIWEVIIFIRLISGPLKNT